MEPEPRFLLGVTTLREREIQRVSSLRGTPLFVGRHDAARRACVRACALVCLCVSACIVWGAPVVVGVVVVVGRQCRICDVQGPEHDAVRPQLCR